MLGIAPSLQAIFQVREGQSNPIVVNARALVWDMLTHIGSEVSCLEDSFAKLLIHRKFHHRMNYRLRVNDD